MFDIKYEPLHQILSSQPHAQIHHSNLYVIQSKPNKCLKYCFNQIFFFNFNETAASYRTSTSSQSQKSKFFIPTPKKEEVKTPT